MDDLTKSVWDDDLPSNSNKLDSENDNEYHSNLGSNTFNSSLTPLVSEFNSYAIDDPFANPFEEPKPDEYNDNDNNTILRDNSNFNAEDEQIHELKSEERKELKDKLISDLTAGVEEEDNILSQSTIKSKSSNLKQTDELFHDQGSPIKVTTQDQESIISPQKSLNVKKFRAVRPRRFNSKTNVQHLREEENDKTEDLLGPLSIVHKKQPENSVDSEEKNDDKPFQNDKEEQESKTKDPIKSTPKKSIDNNDLEITVGDPMKVGDITTAHVVYTIRTKNKNMESPHFPKIESVEVTRRYRDFRWLYHQLQANHPGRIIPPPPSKQSILGRFSEKLIEHRKVSLEKMLNNINNRPELCNDSDFVSFLTNDNEGVFSDSGLEDSSIQENQSQTQNVASSAASVASSAAQASTGFMSSLFSISNKYTEPDKYFEEKKNYIDDLEFNLKQFSKTIELIGNQRSDMVTILEEMATTIEQLSTFEISKTTSDLLNAFGQVEFKVKDNLDRLNLSDQLTIGYTIEEYLRIIESINYIFQTRIKIYQSLSSITNQIEKLSKKQPLSSERSFEIGKLKERQTTLQKEFDDISFTIKIELQNFELSRIDDFRNNVEIYVESSIEAQKESIELYETFYQKHIV
ncbi:VPS5 [Candida pseudojiufengensis]|uniref:VPS5 n=1 Tax=Candida pseudojiufengensis TaxID=497109 RepID=UPI002224A7D3|nr:VPS5 [Candida pseudojiufengensis]KAI5965875.1 VPS5 [Candida pseudojiufengensis]